MGASLRKVVRVMRGKTGVARLSVALMLPLALLMAGCDEDRIEEQLGNASAAALEQSYSVNHDPLLTAWCEGVGETLTAFSTRQQVPYTFRVLETDMVNALATPWGHVYVTQGLLDFVESEDEIVAVIGHEVAHVVHRDAMHGLKQSLLFSLAAGLIRGQNREVGDLAGLGLGLLSLRYSRQDEYNADDAGTMLCYRAGHDPRGMLDFLDRLHTEIERERSWSFLQALLSTHPYTVNRGLRQKNQPHVALHTPAARMRVAAGYLRRGHYSTAAKLLQPEAEQGANPQALLLLADALAGRGSTEEARSLYQLAAQHTTSEYPGLALAALAAYTPPTALPITVQEQASAAALLADESGSRRQTVDSLGRVPERNASLAARLSRPRDAGERALGTLEQVSESRAEVPEVSRTAALRANGAVTRAVEVIYSLEHYQTASQNAAARTAAMLDRLEAQLRSLAVGQGRGSVLDLNRRALMELESAAAALEAGDQLARQSLAFVAEAQESAEQTAQVVRELMTTEEPPSHVISLTQDLTHATRKLADQALAKTHLAQEQARKAELHGLVAALHLAQAAADPARLRGLDVMVAYYLQSTPAQVASLRERGLGYGDVGVALAASGSTGTSPSLLASRLASEASLLDSVTLTSEQTVGMKAMLKFLTQAMLQEVDETVHPQPPG